MVIFTLHADQSYSSFTLYDSPCDCLPTTETHFLSPRICFRNNLLPKFKSSITNTEKIFVAHHCHTGKDLIESQHSPSFFKKRSLKTSGTCKTCASFCFSQEQNFHSLIVNFSIPVDNHWQVGETFLKDQLTRMGGCTQGLPSRPRLARVSPRPTSPLFVLTSTPPDQQGFFFHVEAEGSGKGKIMFFSHIQHNTHQPF